jgi:Family of unknown function (DUF6636)
VTRAALAVLAVLAFAACGGGGDSAKTTGETFATAPPPTSAPSGPGTTSPGTAPPATAPPSGPEAALQSFKTPTGNIGCYLDDHSVRCDIHEHSYTPPPKPASCDLEWGDAIGLSEVGSATFACHGDTVFDQSAPALPYGSRARQGPMVCTSAENGVNCVREGTGHGFFISRQGFNLS